MNEILRDMVYGFAVGDALGVPFEFYLGGTFHCTGMVGYGTWGQPPGTWSDDTSMLLATCDSIRETGRIDPKDMRKRFRRWVRHGEYTAGGEVFDIGSTTRRALWAGHGMKGIYDNGNGSLMRILPLAFVPHTKADIDAVSSITHAHKQSCLCCRTLVEMAKYMMDTGQIPDWRCAEVCPSGYVVDTLNAALYCLKNAHSYAETVLMAVNLGGDTDTIAAISGGLAGILYGYDAIPTEWIKTLKNKELIDVCLF